jgi:FkbM family methyltransferase
MYQILGQRELEVSVDHAPRLIIDGGAHVGCATLFFAHRYPSARILSVEPEESNVELLTRNCGAYPQVMVIRGALWPCRSTLYIQNPAARHDSFQVGPTDMGFARPVRGYTIPELMRLARADRIDILKLDIEGAERELFTSGYEEWLPRVGTLMIELHDRFRAGCAEAVYEAARSRGASWYQSGEYVIFRFPVA